ncbi:hypothetical protein BGW39_003037 [Mortierella sp. 14UC]|nr:hypothetical protein BGW39_003037 [Mortierella sp. 14UC]
MSSSSPQGNSPPPPTQQSLATSGLEITADGQRVLIQLEHHAALGCLPSKTSNIPTIMQGLAATQLGAANILSPLGRHAIGHSRAGSVNQQRSSSTKSGSSTHSPKSSNDKALFQPHKKDTKTEEAVTTPTTASPALTGPVQTINIATPATNVTPTLLHPQSPLLTVKAATIATAAPLVSSLSSTTKAGSLRLNIFSVNVARSTLRTDLPNIHARIDSTPQLVYCCSILERAQQVTKPASDDDDTQELLLEDKEREWADRIEDIEKDRLRWLIDQLVKAFAED